jgi:hypothetical protein
MNEKNNSALVRKPSSALKKAAPRAKRIMSGMVADTLSVAWATQVDKVVCNILIGDDVDGIIPTLLDILTEKEGFGRFSFRPVIFKSASNLRTVTEKQRFDIIAINFTRVRWNIPHKDTHPFPVGEVVDFLRHLKLKHNKPIIVFSTLEATELYAQHFAQAGINYFSMMPLTSEIFISAFQIALKIPRNPHSTKTISSIK